MMSQDGVNFTAYFDSIRIVNLVHRDDRRQEVIEELAKLSIEIDKNNVRFYPAVKPEEPAGFPSVGARGCFMSHLSILKQAHDEGVEKLLILEDDVDFIKTIYDVLPDVITELNNLEWDICYFGHHLSLDASSGSLFKRYDQGIQTTHFYAVKGEVISHLIAFFELILSRLPGDPKGGPMHVDGAISTFRAQNPDVKTIVLCEPIGYQRPSRTDIHALAIYDRIPVIKNILNLYRKIKKRLMRAIS